MPPQLLRTESATTSVDDVGHGCCDDAKFQNSMPARRLPSGSGKHLSEPAISIRSALRLIFDPTADRAGTTKVYGPVPKKYQGVVGFGPTMWMLRSERTTSSPMTLMRVGYGLLEEGGRSDHVTGFCTGIGKSPFRTTVFSRPAPRIVPLNPSTTSWAVL